MKGEKNEMIRNFAEINNMPFATARYALEKGDSYKPKPRKGLTKQYLQDINVYILPADNDYGWEVYQNGKKRPISPTKTGNYSSGRCKYHLYTWIRDENSKQRMISLASLIMVLVIGSDIKPGFVVDHIDNDSFNNSLDNLQILSIRENLDKDNSGHNQHKCLDKEGNL